MKQKFSKHWVAATRDSNLQEVANKVSPAMTLAYFRERVSPQQHRMGEIDVEPGTLPELWIRS